MKSVLYCTLIKNVLKTLAKSVLILLGLTTVASGTDGAIHKKIFGSYMTTFIINSLKRRNE